MSLEFEWLHVAVTRENVDGYANGAGAVATMPFVMARSLLEPATCLLYPLSPCCNAQISAAAGCMRCRDSMNMPPSSVAIFDGEWVGPGTRIERWFDAWAIDALTMTIVLSDLAQRVCALRPPDEDLPGPALHSMAYRLRALQARQTQLGAR